MTELKMTISGFKEIEAALLKIRKVRTRKSAIKRAMIEAAEPMAMLALAYAPVRTGELRATIHVGDKLTRRQAAQAKKDPEMVYVHIGPAGGAQSIAQEFGTVNHPPHPYMRPAWEQDNRAMLARLAETLRKEIFASLGRQR